MFYNTLENYYRTNFSLMHHHKYSLTEVENMMPWERTVYISLLNVWIKEQEEARKAAERR
jgi:hypothetical protein